ncbi:MAG: hypothetical protein IH840_02125 [Candidatus Heimdallarchaeota archaeon]|nr:hypothetical protein [Candidatus Heimdallarchaeota archaeon]
MASKLSKPKTSGLSSFEVDIRPRKERKINTIHDCWDGIGRIQSLDKGIILDGYYDSWDIGFYVILFDPTSNSLVK